MTHPRSDIPSDTHTPLSLPVRHMGDRHPGLTPHVAASYCEAAYVCLDSHHRSPAGFLLRSGALERNVQVEWPEVTERQKRAWNNRSDAVRDGAYAVAIAAVEVVEGLVAIGRAETLTGSDYYLGKPGIDYEDFESAIRLEVSGTDAGGPGTVAARLTAKITQLGAGRSTLSGRACVVGFKAGMIVSADFMRGEAEVTV